MRTAGKKKIVSPVRFVFFLLVIAIISIFVYYNSNLTAVSEDKNSAEQEFTVTKGASVRQTAEALEKANLIKNSLVFRVYCKINEKQKLIAGRYNLKATMSVAEIVEKLNSGKARIDVKRFTIPEGFEMRLIEDKLVAEGFMTKEQFEAAVSKTEYDFSFIKEIPNRDNKLEGYLYPETYEVYKNAKAEDIIIKMLGQFDSVFNEKYRARAKELNMTIDQVITMASIIEREAKHDDERKMVASVFYNRLKQHMPLQSCATVQYLLKERKDVLTFKDLEIESPYNTYKNPGMPPGPIASPGIKSIDAALYPAESDFLYFVAKKDGSHVFTKTYKEHLAAQKKINSKQ